MSFNPPDIVAVARLLADELESARVTYAVGGAIAYGYWAVPRATIDVDITVFIEPHELDRLLDILQASGHTVDRQQAKELARARGQFSCKRGDIRIDLFLPAIPFYDQVKRRLVTVPLAGRPAQILSAEDLTVFKFLFFRGKDIEDVKRIIATQGLDFDASYVRHSLVEMVGEDDERVARLEDLTKTFGPQDRDG